MAEWEGLIVMSFLPSVALMGAQLEGSSAEATGTMGKASRIVLLTCRFRTLSFLAKGLFQFAANLPGWGHRGPPASSCGFISASFKDQGTGKMWAKCWK